MSALAVTFGLATLGLVLAYFKFLYRKRRPGEAPLVPGNFLFGNGREFKSHAINFLQKTHKELGDVFTCRFLTQHWTFILDVHSYDNFNREKNFDFDKIQVQVNQNVFGFKLKDARKMIAEAGKKVNGKYLYSSLGEFVRNLDDCFKTAIPKEEQMGKTITNVSQINTSGNESSTVAVNRFEADKTSAAELVNAQRLLSKAPQDSDFYDGWHEESLREMAAKVFFAPVFYTIFGRPEPGKENSFNPHNFHKQFDIFHKYFNFLFVALPVQLFPEAHTALKNLVTQPTAAEMAQRDGCSEYIKFSNQFMLDQGQTEVDVVSHNLVYLHVNYNTYRAIFWCMYKMMEDKDAMSALRKEIDEFVESKTSAGNIEDNEVIFTADELNKLPVIDAFVSEIFRWSSGVFMVRRCVKDTAFTTSKGETHIVRNGDRVAMYPPFFNYDEETFKDPKVFKHDRYLNTDFYKNGQKIKNPIIGYGSLCPGQKLAQLEIKWFIMNWANTFKYELLDGERTAPNTAHFGHEILPALGDVKCRFQYRENPIAFKYRNSYGDVSRGIDAL